MTTEPPATADLTAQIDDLQHQSDLIANLLTDKLPNSQVDPGTRFDRTEVRLKRELRGIDCGPENSIIQVEAPAIEPPSAPALDLGEALAMVNELVDQLGDGIVLTINANGHVQAKRRVVQYVDL